MMKRLLYFYICLGLIARHYDHPCYKNSSLKIIPVTLILDAFKIILLHSESVSSILNRKVISKEMLLKYLTDNNVPVTTNFTKNTLVDQIIEYWRNTENGTSVSASQCRPENLSTESNKTENFPINVMSRNFSAWFYKNLNENTIQIHDFWNDCTCSIKMVDNCGEIKEDATITSRLVLNLLYTIKQQFNFYFNPNVCHEGVQGRIELHGLVLILCCGTLHTHENAVGFFESVFGLMRDPFSDNNWKIKNIKLQLKSTNANRQPSLSSSETLQQFMLLPVNDVNL